VIVLAGGGTAEARVSDDTDIGCGSEADAQRVQNREPGAEPDDPTADESESKEFGDEAAAEGNDADDHDGDDIADVSDEFGDEGGEDDLGDTSDSEFQNDEHDFEDACPARCLRRGVPVRETSLDLAQGGAEFGEVEFPARPLRPVRTGGAEAAPRQAASGPHPAPGDPASHQ